MATKGNPGDNKTRRSFSIFIVVGLCCFFYLLGAWQRSGFGKGDSIAHEITKNADCSVLSNLNVETHHGDGTKTTEYLQSEAKVFKPCHDQFIDYTPCQDQMRAMTFPRENMNYRERHCPPDSEKLYCLIPAPRGYVTPFPWPKSRDFVPYANAPYKSLTVEKAVQNWIQYEGNVFRFPGGGTQFPHGADAYINQLASVIPIDNGMVRTALDTGCGLHTKRRNRLDQGRLNDLVFVKYNISLRRRYDARDKLDPISLTEIDKTNEWLTGIMYEDKDEDRVFSDDDLIWHDVDLASGAGDPSYHSRATSRLVLPPATLNPTSSYHLVDEEESEENEEGGDNSSEKAVSYGHDDVQEIDDLHF